MVKAKKTEEVLADLERNRALNQPKRKNQEEVIKILALKYDVRPEYVTMVIAGTRNNEAILLDYITYHEKHNKLLKEVINLVPFT